MINYVDLPHYLKGFVKDIDVKSMSHKRNDHSWVYYPPGTLLTDEGIDWFRSMGIVLRDHVCLFSIPEKNNGYIHSDCQPGIPDRNYAINIVISGRGEMQWLSNLQATEIVSVCNNKIFVEYIDPISFDIETTWKGEVGLVRINSPHRIVSETERHCVSIRPQYPSTFEQALDLFKNILDKS